MTVEESSGKHIFEPTQLTSYLKFMLLWKGGEKA